MTTARREGTSVQGILPAPSFRRAGDFIFVSSIYPLDSNGNVVHTQSISPYVGEAEIAAQTRACLGTLKGVLAEAGTSLDRVVKAEVYLADPADFYEFKLVWKEYFPTEPPARTTAVVGEDHIILGCRLNLHAIALAGDSRYQKQTIHVPDVPDPMEAEHAPQAIKAGPFVFPSALPATDFKTGIPVGKMPVYPYYGSDAEMQAHYIFQNLGKVLQAAGSGLDQALKSQLYEVNHQTFHDINVLWGNYMPVPPTRAAMAARGILVPGAAFFANLLFLAPDGEHQKKETRAGIRFHPVDVRQVQFTPGIIAADWLFTAGMAAIAEYEKGVLVTAPPGLPYYFSDVEIQTEFVMEYLRNQLEANGYRLSDIIDARIYLVNSRRDYRGFERAWRRIFEPIGHFPSMSLIPSTQENGLGGILVHELLVEIDLISKKGR
jgi:enamine deaminase RidA (YjgF/YER057c/UK114 family)